jgi:hypothetical protein
MAFSILSALAWIFEKSEPAYRLAFALIAASACYLWIRSAGFRRELQEDLPSIRLNFDWRSAKLRARWGGEI